MPSSDSHYQLMSRSLQLVITDPQRRVYWGVPFSSETVQTPWVTMDSGLTLEVARRRLNFWTELNDYAVSQRGKGAKKEFKIVEEEPSETNKEPVS